MSASRSATVLVLVLVILTAGACTMAGGLGQNRINLVEGAGLRDTIEVEVLEFSAYGADGEPYVHRLSITDAGVLDQLLEALDAPLWVALKLQCIPEYELHFHLRDGPTQEFGYSCHGASFVRSEQDFFRGQDYHPPDLFDSLLEDQLALHPPEPVQASVNVVKEAGLALVIEVEIARVHTSVSSEGEIGVAQVSFEHLRTIRDAPTVGRLVDSLDTDLDLVPQAECLPEYQLRFSLSDGTLVDLSYGCSADGGAVIRGVHPFLRGMDVLPPAEFNALVEKQTGD